VSPSLSGPNETSNIPRESEVRVSEIKFKEEYQRIVPPLSTAEYDTLKDSISKQGVRIPIELNEKLEVLDGHNRVHISMQLGFELILARTHNFNGDSRAQKEFIIMCNLNRRQLNPFQRIELVTKLESIQAELARARQHAGKTTLVQNYTRVKGRVIDILASQAHVSPMTYVKGREILRKSPNEDIQKLLNDETKIDKVYKALKNKEKKQQLLLQAKKIEGELLPINCKLVHGDFREKCAELADRSVDLIFTDPPYAGRNLHLYDSLASHGYRLLKTNGSLVTYAGHYAIPQIMQYMHKRNLQYYWIFAVIHSGPFSSFFAKNILVKWKPLLWFVKGEKPHQNGKIFDLIDSTKPAKILHDDEQSSEDARYVIEQLTNPGEVVCDPFMGSGTTGVVSLNLKRKFIGIEIEQGTFERAKYRLAEYQRERTVC